MTDPADNPTSPKGSGGPPTRDNRGRFLPKPCRVCGEVCASQDEFKECNGGRRWDTCSGCGLPSEDVEPYPPNQEDADALASAGFGTDEDYR